MVTPPLAPGPDSMTGAGVLRRLSGGVRQVSLRMLDGLLPPRCLACDGDVFVQGTLCAGCFKGMSLITPPFCARCGVPFAHDGQAGAECSHGPLCARCAETPPAFASARAALRYDAGAKRLVLSFKHGDRTDLAWPLARQMARVGAEMLSRADLIAPVPAHWRRLLQRRYDQAALLAGALGILAARPVLPDLLRRIRRTLPLGEMRASERSATVSGVFAVPPRHLGPLAGRNVLLVDDVLTTGSTAEACSRALLAAGAARVDVLAAARVPDPRLRDA